MKSFHCTSCWQTIVFENTRCEKCGHHLGFLPERLEMTAVEPRGDHWIAAASGDGRYRFCKNWELHGCNWLTEPGEDFCLACRHNRTIPDLSDPRCQLMWQKTEQAKRRLFYSLIRLGLPIENPQEPLVFDFVADTGAGSKPTMGHSNGVITITVEESDDATREGHRNAMGEPYRTLLGHFRHEIGHYYWDRLVRDGDHIDAFREIFGDERIDYTTALKSHYERKITDPGEGFISAYATSHPWEDFAETFAHYLHIVDTLETARAMGVSLRPFNRMELAVAFDPYRAVDVNDLVETWLHLAFAVNNLNRSMGQPDLYPFVLSPKVAQKFAFVIKLVQESARAVHQESACAAH
ncbi:zinc-binding metallopeptidase family protein [Methylocystis bryophila]|uniref:Zinc-ribbon domain-containing protein n=1 Tax=Methylocystis bryophila TaxID=655015 RepID=A0A1W6MTQ0_9HYPH|nr:putative zinc-binding peptidase [Methylocystis bryophila]ARN80968.1 hypothetical protein B1812_07660 [Methylocystis bryophila]BDV36875.1 hypothetical protein DSM21852_01280 [Methylocystis bryophila]